MIKTKTAKYVVSGMAMCQITYRDQTIVGLRLSTYWDDGPGQKNDFSDKVFGQICEYFSAQRTNFDFDIDITHLTPFQQSILRELQNIPYGQTRSYKQIATAIGNPQAARAVGSACNRNPIHLIIPCHRVVGANGALTGYAAGLELKQEMLELEKTHK